MKQPSMATRDFALFDKKNSKLIHRCNSYNEILRLFDATGEKVMIVEILEEK